MKYNGKPVQFGAEKEFDLKKAQRGDRLFDCIEQPKPWKPEYSPDGQDWDELDDWGKAKYVMAYEEVENKSLDLGKKEGSQCAKVSREKTGEVEIASKPFDHKADLDHFTKTYGFGHVHVSWVRGADDAETREKQLIWLQNANLYSFLASLESGGHENGNEPGWRFTVRALSIPTDQHIKLFKQFLTSSPDRAPGLLVPDRPTPFAKHLLVNMRNDVHQEAAGGWMYGESDRIGIEIRGGSKKQKKRILDSLCHPLEDDNWVDDPTKRWGERANGNFSLPRLPDAPLLPTQVEDLPQSFLEHLDKVCKSERLNLDSQEIFHFVREAVWVFSDNGQRSDERGDRAPSRLLGFDQRAFIPLLEYEELPWLTDADRQRVKAARRGFVERLQELVQENPQNGCKAPCRCDRRGKQAWKLHYEGSQRAIAIADAIVKFATEAKLQEPFANWLTPPR